MPLLNFISTMTSVRQLVEISRFYGKDKNFVIAGGGNTSYKDDKFMWIKASGASLANITEDDFAVLDRERLKTVETRKYSEYSNEREKQIKNDLFRSCVYPELNLRPSVETSLHEMIHYHFVVHTHPTIVNALMCSNGAELRTRQLFGDKVLYVPYTDPGYTLFKKVKADIAGFRDKFQCDPSIIFIQNHGILVSADTTDEVKSLHQWVISILNAEIPVLPDITLIPADEKITRIVPAIRMMLTEKTPVTVIVRHHHLLQYFYEDAESFQRVSLPLTPDAIQYCNTRPVFIENTSIPGVALKEAAEKLESYKRIYKSFPKIVILKDLCCLSVGINYKSAEIAMDVFEDQMKISFLSGNFGGSRFMNDREIGFIHNQAVDNMKMLLSKGESAHGRVAGKTIVIANGVDKFGLEMAEDMMMENANVVVAGRDEPEVKEIVASLNARAKDNQVVFVKADVFSDESIQNLMLETVNFFGGVDAFMICDHGIKGTSFGTLSRTAIRSCTQHASEVLKLQASYKNPYFTDIIEIRAQPGLESSDNTLRQPEDDKEDADLIRFMAIELFSFCIKVNSIQPGNFFRNSIWSDPQTGLFQEYLNAGKVPGATNIDDVKAFYERQVPAGRGCETKDVMRAIYYFMEQEYETSQVLKVTGGLNR
jgi:rhamnose utilization protein RhaD (predicted bifunctional aldolase and dehydrogenase)/NAD(P)-dependent dehydrogenase (short-subunit alcohol dehydrogenase family)